MISLINKLISKSKPGVSLQTASKPVINTSKALQNQDSETAEEAPAPARKKAKLIMVTTSNNNKFYDMEENGDDTFTVTYGRVGVSGTTLNYPMHQWEKIKRAKIRKGYKDTTHLFSTTRSVSDFLAIDNEKVSELFAQLLKYAKQSIFTNYNVSSKDVSIQQVEEAQRILDSLVSRVKKRMRLAPFNEELMSLYTIIPRKMSNVNHHLVKTARKEEDRAAIQKLLSNEQDTLDVMRGQVEMHKKQNDQEVQPKTLPEAFGLQVELLEDAKLIKQIKKMMGSKSKTFYRAYKVINSKTQKGFDAYMKKAKDKKTQLFWHGSRNENWLSILKTGLVLRPANAVINGKMFGYGLYFADRFEKSLNYSSLNGAYWSRGSSNRGFLALYDVHVGKQLKIKKHADWCCKLSHENLKKRGSEYDSVFAKGGYDLINNEYIVYNQQQCTVRYIVEVR